MYGGSHDAFTRLVGCYNDALRAWEDNPTVQEAATNLGMTQREYCDGWISRNCGPLVWTSAGSSPPLDNDGAYREAARLRAERKGLRR